MKPGGSGRGHGRDVAARAAKGESAAEILNRGPEFERAYHRLLAHSSFLRQRRAHLVIYYFQRKD
jgi:hypothetical protein